MPPKKSLSETLRAELKRQKVSANELARRMSDSPESYKSVRRHVRKLLAGETRAVLGETAEKLDRALGTINVFAQFVHVEPVRGTRAVLADQIAAWRARDRADIEDLQKRVEKLERMVG